jgi:hypothetical protein
MTQWEEIVNTIMKLKYSLHRSMSNKVKKFYNSITCNLARIMSRGFVINVVVNPPRVPAVHCMNKCDTHVGSNACKWSEKYNVQKINYRFTVYMTFYWNTNHNIWELTLTCFSKIISYTVHNGAILSRLYILPT